jgi:hypothetical protein
MSGEKTISKFEQKNNTIVALRRIVEMALATEEKHYESEETLPGWIIEAREQF